MIGGDGSRAGERWWICNSQLRWVFDEDPDRYEITRGYLWGLYAYLNGFGAAWLQQQHADCAGAALHALKVVSARPITPVRRWLVASLIKATKQWCETALNRAEDKKVAERYRDLPMLIAPFS